MKRGIFWEEVVAPGKVLNSCEKKGGGVVYSEREGYILGGSHNITVVEKGGIFWEGGVDSGKVAHINLLKRGH